MEGFDAGDVRVPAPLVEVSEGTREQLVTVVSAIVCGATPEEIATLLAGGRAVRVQENVDGMLSRSGEREEVSAHVDVILGVLQTPAGVTT